MLHLLEVAQSMHKVLLLKPVTNIYVLGICTYTANNALIAVKDHDDR